jgi:hypothetical protein
MAGEGLECVSSTHFQHPCLVQESEFVQSIKSSSVLNFISHESHRHKLQAVPMAVHGARLLEAANI